MANTVTTREENELVLIDLNAKLYRFDKECGQWKERGVGPVKLLKHMEIGKVRLVMRQNWSLKVCANHLVLPTLKVQEHHGNKKACVWHAADFADGKLKEENFCIRFASMENCRQFRNTIEEITKALAGEDEVKKLTVEEEDEEKTDTKEVSSTLGKEC